MDIDKLVAAIDRHAEAIERLAGAITQASSGALTSAQPSKAAHRAKAAKKTGEAAADAGQAVETKEEAAVQKSPAAITPATSAVTEEQRELTPAEVVGRKPYRTEAAPLPPREGRKACEVAIRKLAEINAMQDITRCLDSVDASRLGEVEDFVLPFLLRSLTVALEEHAISTEPRR